MPNDIPVACCLSNAALREREATLFVAFKAAALLTEAMEDGYLFRLPGDEKTLALVVELITVERECCPFLTFHLTVQAQMGPIALRLTGPPGTREFLQSILG